MWTQVAGLVIDIGLGALAYRLASQLEAVVTTLRASIESHGARLDKIEDRLGRTAT